MVFALSDIVPWGRSFDEYCAMFSLGPEELARRIVSVADGPASFNAELSARGGSVISVDPVYRFDAEQIRGRIAQVYPVVLQQTEENTHNFIWKQIDSVAQLGRIRMNAMNSFLTDFESAGARRRYVAAALPFLPFADNAFDLCICSHFLFLYSAQLSAAFHRCAIAELLRIARHVRIFPLQTLAGVRSEYVQPVMAAVSAAGYTPTIEPVAYEFQRGAHEMLTIRK